uniref:Pdgfa associated protein 1a n=1 Tax=Labrus bergylta TaxID=56723 RepID=A0A3Q3E4R7_9LABR
MPRGGKRSHKGRGKQFSNPEEIDRQMKAQKELEENPGAEKGSASESGDESSSEDESDSRKRSGVEGLIEIENPNRVSQKSKKVAELDVTAPRELSRREREEIEKQKSKERYMKLHLEGKTEQCCILLLGNVELTSVSEFSFSWLQTVLYKCGKLEHHSLWFLFKVKNAVWGLRES